MKTILYKRCVFAMFALLAVLFITGCEKSDKENQFLAKTTMQIDDPVRHYYPVLQGLKQNIIVKVTNTGNEPLKIHKVLPSCGCTIAKFSTSAIAPGNDGFIQMEYDSTKNIGYVGIYTTIIANTDKHHHTMFFDINVVPESLHTKDYEELYRIEQEKKAGVDEAVEGGTNQRGYVVDSTEVRKFM